MYNFFIGILAIVVGIVFGSLFIFGYLFLIGYFIPIEQQTGLLLTVASASVGIVSAMIMFVVGHSFYEKYQKVWWF